MIILYIFLSLPLVLLLLAAVPVWYVARYDEENNFSFRARYLFATYDLESSEFRIFGIKIGGRKKKSQPPPKEKKSFTEKVIEKTFSEIKPEKIKSEEKKSAKKKESVFKTLADAYELLTDGQVKTIIKPILATFIKLIKIILPKHLYVRGVIGFTCPASTGMFFGAYSIVAEAFNLQKSVCLAGDFNTNETVFRINAKARGSVSALRIAFPIARLLLIKPVRVFILNMIRKGV
jgi:hypothetical protein